MRWVPIGNVGHEGVHTELKTKVLFIRTISKHQALASNENIEARVV